MRHNRRDCLRGHFGRDRDAGGGPRSRRSEVLRLGVFAVPDRNAVCHCGVWQAQRSNRPRQTAASRSCDLSGWPSRIRHGSAYGPTARGPTGAGTRQRHHECRDLRLCRAGFQPYPAAQDVHLHFHRLGPTVVRRTAGCRVADRALELALGVSRRDSCGALRCRNGPSEPVAHDALPPATHQPMRSGLHHCGLPGWSASLRLRCSLLVSDWTGSDWDYWSAVWQCSWCPCRN